jgi:ankyrin repeat protein
MPIIYAALCGRLATVKLLVDRGADKSARTNDGMNALLWAGLVASPHREKGRRARESQLQPHSLDRLHL